MKNFRVGILGCGGIAHRHATILQDLKEVELVAYCDVAPERAQEYNAQYSNGKAGVYSNTEKFLDEAKLDVVVICLPPFAQRNDSGPNAVEIAASRGVHILIEKPIALDLETAQRQVDAIEKHGVKSQVGFMFRFGEAVEKVKKSIESGEAGVPGWGIGTYQCNSLHGPWWREKDKSGGQIVEQIIHTYDIMRYLMGEVEQVFCYAGNEFHKDVERYTSEDASACSIRFKSGAVASLAGTNGAIPGKWLSAYSVACQNLTANFIDANNATLYYHDGQNVKKKNVESQRDFSREQTLDLLRAITENSSTRTPIGEGYKTLELVLAARESSEAGRPVTL